MIGVFHTYTNSKYTFMLERYGMVEPGSFAMGLNRTGALTDWYPGIFDDNFEEKSESSITQWLNKMKAGKSGLRIPKAYVDAIGMRDGRLATRIAQLIQEGCKGKHGDTISFLGLELAQGGFGYRGNPDPEAIRISGNIRIWIEFQHAPTFPKFGQYPERWITDETRPDLEIFAIKLIHEESGLVKYVCDKVLPEEMIEAAGRIVAQKWRSGLVGHATRPKLISGRWRIAVVQPQISQRVVAPDG
ncbi:hypothetical protein MMC11_006367 [Xylographa trunciseda]|nr:hypothetical protein [Xylographa trunciseda]